MVRPIRIGISCDLIDMDIPFLLSRDAMENTGASISFRDNRLTVRNLG